MDSLTKYTLRSNDVEVLFEDDHVLVLNKPPGLLVIADRFNPSLPNLLALLRSGSEDALVVHRLDKDTSGCIVFGKTAEAHAHLSGQFEARSVTKVYTALCKGIPPAESGVIDLPLRESESSHLMKVDRKKGKESVTEYRVIETFHGFSVVELRPRTGRMHQIRVHLASVGAPLVADPLYGNKKPFFLSSVKRGYKAGKEPEKPLLSRAALHAEQLSFTLPDSGAPFTISAPLPKDMRSTVRMLRKYAPPR